MSTNCAESNPADGVRRVRAGVEDGDIDAAPGVLDASRRGQHSGTIGRVERDDEHVLAARAPRPSELFEALRSTGADGDTRARVPAAPAPVPRRSPSSRRSTRRERQTVTSIANLPAPAHGPTPQASTDATAVAQAEKPRAVSPVPRAIRASNGVTRESAAPRPAASDPTRRASSACGGAPPAPPPRRPGDRCDRDSGWERRPDRSCAVASAC